jgi:hypothetical protein
LHSHRREQCGQPVRPGGDTFGALGKLRFLYLVERIVRHLHSQSNRRARTATAYLFAFWPEPKVRVRVNH